MFSCLLHHHETIRTLTGSHSPLLIHHIRNCPTYLEALYSISVFFNTNIDSTIILGKVTIVFPVQKHVGLIIWDKLVRLSKKREAVCTWRNNVMRLRNYLMYSVCFVKLHISPPQKNIYILSVTEKCAYGEFMLPNNKTYFGLHVKYLI
jgi:hypothetical protein